MSGADLVLQLLDLIGRLKNEVLENFFLTVMQVNFCNYAVYICERHRFLGHDW